MRSLPALFRIFAVLLVSLALILSADGKFVMAEMVPVERLVKNAEAYLNKHKDEAEAHYTLARIHYLAFSFNSPNVRAYTRGVEKDAMPRPAPRWMAEGIRHDDAERKEVGDTLSKAELIDHAARAARGFREAIRLAPNEGLYQLGLACLLEEVHGWQDVATAEGLPPELQNITVQKYRGAYSKAFALAIGDDSKLKRRPISGVKSLTSYEAASALVRLAEQGENTLTASEKRELKEAREAVAKFNKLPMGPITPIVFSLRSVSRINELLAPDKIVDFDLRGYGTQEQWTWVKPDTGFLVWDPAETGNIHSARQMFGSYTFQIFRQTGYDALSALDDNHDGILSGPELDGLSVWFDRNSDGCSTPDEVLPLRELGIVSIAVEAVTRDGIHPMNPHGITLSDGRTLPTWDWIVEPVSNTHIQPAHLWIEGK